MNMDAIMCFLGSFILIVSLLEGQTDANTYNALFAFGDSYADTGNRDKFDSTLNLVGEANNAPWRIPYGQTWPGIPFGRFSNGRVFTDFYASHLKVKPPVPYSLLNSSKNNNTMGINFAYGGSGVLSSLYPTYPNVTAQIQELRYLVNNGVVSKKLIASSICVLVIAGNDYTIFLATNPTNQVSTFIPKLINGIGANLEALYELGFRSIVVSNLEPTGCLPSVTSSNNYTECNDTLNNAISVPHNQQLDAKLTTLREKYTLAKFKAIDFYSAFNVAKDTYPLRPCCQGINGGLCGSVNSNGAPLYTVCPLPQRALFWDGSHPTDSGWKTISRILFN